MPTISAEPYDDEIFPLELATSPILLRAFFAEVNKELQQQEDPESRKQLFSCLQSLRRRILDLEWQNGAGREDEALRPEFRDGDDESRRKWDAYNLMFDEIRRISSGQSAGVGDDA